MPQWGFWPKVIAFLGYDPLCREPEGIAEQIGCLCRRRGLSKERLAKVLGVRFQMLAGWERGSLTPSERHRERVAGLCRGALARGNG